MTPIRVIMLVAPCLLMLGTLLGLSGIEQWTASLGTTPDARVMLGRIGIALPYIVAAAIGIMFLFGARGAVSIRSMGAGVLIGTAAVMVTAVLRETMRLSSFADSVPAGASIMSYVDPATSIGATLATVAGVFALRVAMRGDAAFASAVPRRIHGKRSIHGDAEWMAIKDARRLFPEAGGIVVGEAYRVDKDTVAERSFRADDQETWGVGGRSPLLCFDGSFGSTHGLVFAGSGGFKTTSVTIPTALKWGGSLVALDPSNEVAPMVVEHRRKAGRDVFILDPRDPSTGFNVLDWIGRFGGTKEEDLVAVANWVVTDTGRQASIRDDFFRASALQLITALIADVCLSGHTKKDDQHLRQMRANLSEPEPKLRERLQLIYDNSGSEFVKENVAPFIAMTPETFSGVYANAVKETHWLSYPNYAALVSGSSFATDAITSGKTDIFVNLDLKTLEAHPGLARTIIGALLNAIYSRDGKVESRTLFLLDEVARLGYLRILETARDAGRKYGISLMLLFQSIGQMREAYGGRDATSKWFESAAWVSFAAINDPDTADYISRRCGNTTVEVDQLSRSSQMSGSSRTRSKHLTARPLILPDEVLRMRGDEQIIFTAGNAPLRCGRAVWFRRSDMKSVVSENRFRRAR
ncbi:Ti-type conjugative transfer system protein TraG [Mesorhizobium sp. B2-5-13]|uniref:Ti-type conjugative transfer system protein TraG n=1 Tax=unclassified Mesorhizobium TaxID=325217 RepID=UPI001129D476|nr:MULTISPECIES: Ti-type conjugative transfer system protein TraG [unclassified Mesorhizobium]TPJ81906.1 Ti-type conjugative transfer system protein TraG [Mesorhizobium sp. B2-5-13]TPK45843.1 Ti-type conjugative transfer system protein TraG [Mesorhizobium sp. B2-5-5]